MQEVFKLTICGQRIQEIEGNQECRVGVSRSRSVPENEERDPFPIPRNGERDTFRVPGNGERQIVCS
jgi:hypothetical protein